MSILDKGKSNLKYGGGKPQSLKLMPDGNPYPYEREYIAINGVQDDEKVSEGFGDPDYNPKIQSNVGDDGNG